MSTYRIHAGDTLSGLAHRFGTSVSALMQSNHQIHDRNLIRAGASLNVPGARDEFTPPAPTTSPRAPTADAAPTPAGHSSSRAYDLAKSLLGWTASALKRSANAVGRAMHDFVPNTRNCANFVSGVLEAAGQLRKGEHSDSVTGLMHNLDGDRRYRRVPLSQAKPGDVVSFKTKHGHHVELFAGWSGGRPQYIGSNNVNADGTQRVSTSRAGYPILAIHHFVG